MFEPEVFRKHMYCIEDSTCDIVVSLAVVRRPGNFAPFVTPLANPTNPAMMTGLVPSRNCIAHRSVWTTRNSRWTTFQLD